MNPQQTTMDEMGNEQPLCPADPLDDQMLECLLDGLTMIEVAVHTMKQAVIRARRPRSVSDSPANR